MKFGKIDSILSFKKIEATCNSRDVLRLQGQGNETGQEEI